MNTENNKIIAEFLGYDTIVGITVVSVIKNNQLMVFNPNSDWNWLMEVVEKCFSIEHNYYYHKNIEDALIYNSKNRIEAVYQACVEFIEVYNESLKQESCISIRDLNFSAQNKI